MALFNYDIFRCDRSAESSQFSRGGGVLIVTKSHLSCTAIENPDESIEQIWVLLISNHKRFIFGCVYIPPLSDSVLYDKFGLSLNTIRQKFPDAELYVFGDFNLPRINWNNTTLGVDAVAVTQTSPFILNSATTLSHFINFNNLHQFNTITNKNDVLLDLVFSNVNYLQITNPDDILSKIDNHHPPLNFSLNIKLPKIKVFAPLKFDFKKCNYQDITDYLNSLDWYHLFSNSDLETNIDIFYNIIYTTFCDFIPTYRHIDNDYPPWFTNDIRNTIQNDILKKKLAHKKYKRTGLEEDYLAFSSLRSLCKYKIAAAHSRYNTKTENNILHDPKSFWKFVNSYNSDTNIPSKVTLGNTTSTSLSETADLFASFFGSVYNTDSDNLPTLDNNPEIPTILSDINISLSEVLKSLSELKIDRGAAPDGIPNVYLKECRLGLASPLTILFNKSLSAGKFPTQRKSSSVTPIYKKGKLDDVSNYRPISILNSIPKLLEKIITPIIYNSFSHLFIEQQHGFSGSKSTLSNLAIITSYISNALDRHRQVDVVYTDFAKAFDKVPHKRLIEKLSKCGLRGPLLRWISDYLSGREQMVKISDIYSLSYLASSGVPQGSHLGPLLFLFFINDVASVLKYCRFLLFADDAKFFLEIDSLESAAYLQEDLTRFEQWCDINGMVLNVEKCHVIRYTTKKLPLIVNYTLYNTTLLSVNEIKDLGITFSCNGSFKLHMRNIVNKAFRVLGFVRHTLPFVSPSTFLLLCVSLVRPIIEYASPIWSPYFMTDINLLESVQRRFMRHLAYLNGTPMSYTNHNFSFIYNTFSIKPLYLRRKTADMLFLFKIVNNMINSTELYNLLNFHVHTRTLRTNSVFALKTSSHLRDQNSVLNRIQYMGNTLGVNHNWIAMNIYDFKRLLDQSYSYS